jgi:hypothetical protein
MCAPSTFAQIKPKETIVAKFRMQELDTSLKVGYAVALVDVDNDKKTDIVVVDTTRVVWYQNPTWKKRTIIDGQTKPDNVCIAAYDIDGDGLVDFALGADWKPFNTKSGGTLQWLKRGKTLDEKWTVHPIGEVPTIHRIRFADMEGSGKPQLLVVPLMGRGSSSAKNWMDGEPVEVLAYDIPKNPAKDRWESHVLDRSLHVVHNFAPIPAASGKGMDVLAASYEGVSLIQKLPSGKWATERIGTGNQKNSLGRLGASEIKQGKLKSGRKFIATIEPWHGNQVVVYTEPAAGQKMWQRHVIDEELRWGHAIWCADMDGDGSDELIVGVRDLNPGGTRPEERWGVRVYKAENETGSAWSRQILDPGGVSVEDLAVADLDGDGRPDIVAVGRFTHNVRIYWNEGKGAKN